MGRATIVSGGADGRYTVTLDYGTTLQDAIVAGLNSALVTLQNLKSQAEAQIIIADESEAAQQVKIDEAVEAYIEESSSLPPGSPYPDTSLIDAEMRELRRLQVAHVPLRQQLVKLKFEIADVTKRIASYSAIVAEVTKQVWCTTFYEDGAAASVVGTIDIPGDTNLTLIAPDCRAWNSAIDGDLRARGLCSPEQAYFN
ncbi:MAG: hypothetical protein RLZZ524_650, partial [Pseudomonadota bacterium]